MTLGKNQDGSSVIELSPVETRAFEGGTSFVKWSGDSRGPFFVEVKLVRPGFNSCPTCGEEMEFGRRSPVSFKRRWCKKCEQEWELREGGLYPLPPSPEPERRKA